MRASVFLNPLAVTLIAVGAGGAPLRAEGDDNLKTIMAFCDKVTLAIQGGKANGNTVVSLAYPGLQISEGFTQANEADRAMLCQLFDQIPLPSPVYQPSGQTYSSVYGHILANQKNTTVEMKDSEKEALAAALKLTNPEGAAFLNYQGHQNTFKRAANDRDVAAVNYESAMEDQKMFRRSPDEVKRMTDEQKNVYLARKQVLDNAVLVARNASQKAENDLVNADNAWKGLGNKAAIASAESTISTLTSLDATTWWLQLRQRFKLGEWGNGAQHVVDFFPSPDTWNKAPVDGKPDPTWMKLTFRAGEESSQSSQSAKAADATAAVNAGIAKASVSVAWSKAIQEAASAENGFEISLELKKVAVFRPWMEMMVFKNENWWFNDNYKNDVISFGNLTRTSDKQLMPVYLHTVILARNVVMRAKSFAACSRAFQECLSVRVRVSVGPISVSSGYSKSDSGEHKEAKLTETSIEVPGVQILGYISSAVDRSPARTVAR